MRSWSLLLLATLTCASSPMPVSTSSELVCTASEETEIPYDRSEWKHWQDLDGDCQDSRQEVLIRDSLVPVVFKTDRECRVVAGKWVDPYTGETIVDASLVDIDHIVALKDAHVSGGYSWSFEERELYANDLDNLTVSGRSSNRSKGEKGPDEWLPPEQSFRCVYIEKWVGIKARWSLFMSESESALIAYMQKSCERGETPHLPQN